MAVNACPIGVKPQFELADGTPAVGNKLFFYVAGSTSTKQNTYTTSAGSVANANPLILNSLGMPTTEIWFTAGQSYKVVYAPSTDTDPPASPIWTIDNLVGINDTTSSQTEWIAGPTPTYISATSFSLVGDQTSIFQVGRRLKTTNTGGTIYSTITASAFAAVTTITVVSDSGTLDSGLSAVSYGLISATNTSVSTFGEVVALGSVSGTNTITASASVAAAGYRTLQVFSFVPANTNTSATTININSMGAKNIFFGGVACVGGELVLGLVYIIIYDGTQFQAIAGNYSAGSFVGTLTGATTSPTTTVSFTVSGKQVTLDSTTTFSVTSNANSKTITGMPARLFPVTAKLFSMVVADNGGAQTIAQAAIGTDGVITVYKDAAANVWTAAGAAIVSKFCVTYTLA